MGSRESSTTRVISATATAWPVRDELDRYHRLAAAARAGLVDWRARLRVTAYALYRHLGEDARHRLLLLGPRSGGEASALLIGTEIQALADLIDAGRAEPAAPDALTRATAEALGGAILHELCLAAGRGGSLPPEAELIPTLMYSAVLPYAGAEAASEELRIPPPPR